MLEKTSLDGVIIVEPKRFQDDRGFFSETWNRQALADVGIELDFLQDNHSLSVNAGTVRGLHYQSPPHAQAKLVRVGRGSIRDVAVDARVGSPTYGDWVSVDLSAENGRQLLVPSGYLHGFVTQEPNTEVNYKCTDYYAPDCDGSIRFDDPDIRIDWGLPSSQAILSDKDAAAPSFADFDSPFIYEK